MNVLTAKAALRRSMVDRVRAVSSDDAAAAAGAAARVLSDFLSSRLPSAAVIGFHASTATELPSEPAARLLAQRYTLAYPLVSNGLITFHRTDWDTLSAHSSKVREPLPRDPEVHPDAIVIPGRAFDRYGIRLGHGAGYYDRTLPGLKPGVLLVGYCYSFQVVDALPRDPHDTGVQWIITNGGIQRCEPPPPLVHPHQHSERASAHA